MRAMIKGRVLGLRSNPDKEDKTIIYNSMDVYDSETGRVVEVNIKPEAVAPCRAFVDQAGVVLASIFIPYTGNPKPRFNYLSFEPAK